MPRLRSVGGGVMSGDVFRCDYCGQYAGLEHAVISWRHADTLGDGRDLWMPSTHCCAYCAEQAAAPLGSTRV